MPCRRGSGEINSEYEGKTVNNLVKKIHHLNGILFGGKAIAWGVFFFQRRFLSGGSRRYLLKILLSYNRILGRGMATQSAKNDTRVSELQSSGLLFLSDLLNKSQINEVVADLETKMVAAPYKDPSQFFPIPSGKEPQEYHVAFHKDIDVIGAPHLMSLANHPEVLRVAEGFLGVKPTISYMSAWWSFATNDEALQAENFHRDVDGITFLKLFCFLTDVDEQNGPHVYVPSSAHSLKFRDSIRRYSDQEVIDEFGINSIKEITGPAGSIFMEDTFGLHKGQKLKSGRRLLFQVIYSTARLPFSPASPIMDHTKASSKFNFDLWTNRIYVC